jgi:hypothetical protein
LGFKACTSYLLVFCGKHGGSGGGGS